MDSEVVMTIDNVKTWYFKDEPVYGMMSLDSKEEKDALCRQFVQYMFDRTNEMFKWNGLPDTIPQRVIELQIQNNGYTTFFEYDSNLYVAWGSLGGIPNYNYMPTISIVANPYLKLNKEFEIDKDCVIIPNDTFYRGLVPINRFYASQLVEAIVSMRVALINMRAPNVFAAPDDNTYRNIVDYIKDLENGKLSVIQDTAFAKNVASIPFGSASDRVITQLIEEIQYIKASWFNELGLQANYNMKRESINTNESQLNQDSLLPLIDNMLIQRQLACEKINKMFGTNISVELNSSWKKVNEEVMNPETSTRVDEERKEEEESDNTKTDRPES